MRVFLLMPPFFDKYTTLLHVRQYLNMLVLEKLMEEKEAQVYCLQLFPIGGFSGFSF